MRNVSLQAELLSLQVGKPQQMTDAKTGKTWESGIFKAPVDGPVWLGQTNLHGDGQADLKNHGGVDKAVLAYAAAHYPAWQADLGLESLAYGAFGENFTLKGITEADVCLGDVFQVGEARVQVSQPRQPCWKLARRWHVPTMVKTVQENGRTGWYLRVLAEGHVRAGDVFTLQERPCPDWPVARANAIMHGKPTPDDLRALLDGCPTLAESWRHTLSKRLEKHAAD